MFYSQKDLRWSKTQLGTCKGETLGASGCKVASLGNLLGKSPVEINDLLLKKNGYTSGCLISDAKVAPILGLGYDGAKIKPAREICIAETNHWASKGVPQHFFLWRPGNEIVDPLDLKPTWKKNPYFVVSYRLFTLPKTVPVSAPKQEEASIVIKVQETPQSAPQERTRDDSPILEPAEALPSVETYIQIEKGDKLEQIAELIAKEVKPTWLDFLKSLINKLTIWKNK